MSATKRVRKPASEREESHMWTKDEINLVIDLWESTRTEDIAEKLGVNPLRVTYMAYVLRNAGYPMAQKHRKGKMFSLIEEIAGERGVALKKTK